MKLCDPCEYLAGISYPGRGILLGLSADGAQAVLAYFIMGRSENSRNRVFTVKGGGLVTEPADPAKMVDPRLIIYSPVRVFNPDITVVTNGDQTDTIIDSLSQGKTFEDALRTRTFEPDAPNFTPRISGLMDTQGGAVSYRLSILKSADGAGTAVERAFFEYSNPVPGEGRIVHTYAGDGNPLPSFSGEPVRVSLPHGDADLLADLIWNALDPQNKVSLFVRTISLAQGRSRTCVLNRRSLEGAHAGN